MVEILAGTSGYSYKEWKGNFYPEKIANSDMLSYYGDNFPTVEINNTFYRMPNKSILERWSEQTPPNFRFAVKAPRRITHSKRLKDAEDETAYLCQALESLGNKLGVVLFQLPPFFKKDVSVLSFFVDSLPADIPVALEFRHPSWRNDEVLKCLEGADIAWCISDKQSDTPAELLSTASWGYLRLRQPNYTKPQLRSWLKKIRHQEWRRAYVYFKHEAEGAGPRMAEDLLGLSGL